ncbi:hypothetical protein [Streptomyces sp. MJM1172]|uniref:hypothetical protein n=1 Tax=Streptomyces sp. MJM1172 TaxID=1703926 RepID=UPI00093A502B|nr:hypothetical protein [Streptomyces sp. MJM1172]OKI71392.1 hypothetical protein AMK15_01830 [Streptomyces sp. MJM1172]
MASTIKARDFNPNTTDPNRDQWKRADMDAVIEALDGATVFLEIDKRIGTTHTGHLVRTSNFHMAGSVLLVDEHTPQGTWFALFSVGMILDPRPIVGAKWRALEIRRQKEREACAAK